MATEAASGADTRVNSMSKEHLYLVSGYSLIVAIGDLVKSKVWFWIFKPYRVKETSVSNKFSRLFTEPLIQFLIIGAGIYGLYAMFGTPEEDFRDTVVHVDSNRINAFISGWESRWNRPPTTDEIDGLIQSYIKEDILYRQAVSMGLNEDDPITRRRMAQKLEFLTSDLAMLVQPKAGELEGYFEQNKERYREPERITFIQVFLDPDRRGEATLVDAGGLLTQLKAAGAPDPQTLQAGDQNMLQNYFQSADQNAVARQMGSGFAESVMPLKVGQWHGPVLSGYGVHLVYVFDFQQPPPAVLADVKTAVLENWKFEQREQFNADFLEGLKSRYEIVIDEIPSERILIKPETIDDPAS